MRLFTAIDIPEAWRAEATRAQGQLAHDFEAELRLVARPQLHVSVRFLGNVEAGRVPDLVRAVEAIPPLAVGLVLERAGTFGPATRPTVVWLGIGIGADDSRDLLGRVDQALFEAGLAPSDQSWHPHLTLARVRRQVGAQRRQQLAEAVRALPIPSPNPVVITGVSLVRSDLGNSAPRHKLIARSAVS